VKEGEEEAFAPGEKTLVKGAVNPNFKWQTPEFKSLKKGSIGKNLMAEEKNEKDATCENCNQTGSGNQEEKEEAYFQERLKPTLLRLNHRPGYCAIPEWMERWALGD